MAVVGDRLVTGWIGWFFRLKRLSLPIVMRSYSCKKRLTAPTRPLEYSRFFLNNGPDNPSIKCIFCQ